MSERRNLDELVDGVLKTVLMIVLLSFVFQPAAIGRKLAAVTIAYHENIAANVLAETIDKQ